jgi:hypothetical protein
MALSEKFSVAVSAIAEIDGVTVMVTVQVPPFAATGVPIAQVEEVMAKSAAFVPVMEGFGGLFVKFKGALPVFVNVTVICALSGETGTEPKSRVAGRLTTTAVPVPESSSD